jgi:hypothetical protein
VTLFLSLCDREPVEVTTIVRAGAYLGVPILVVADEGDGWLLSLWPDKERPGRSHGALKPFTYRRGEWWRLWGEQVTHSDHTYEMPPFPLRLEPKPEAAA